MTEKEFKLIDGFVDYALSDLETIKKLKAENEKLKKTLKILTHRIIIKAHRNFLFGGRYLDVASTTMKLTDEEYELLKEVLGE